MENDGYGWKIFAGILVILVGVFNVIDGLTAAVHNWQAKEAPCRFSIFSLSSLLFSGS